MKKNTFYIFAGVSALILLLLFSLSIKLTNPVPVAAGFVCYVLLILLLRRKIDGIIHDERQTAIDMHASAVTIRAAAVMFVTVNLGTAVYVFSEALGFHRPPIETTVPIQSLGAYPPFIHAPPAQIPTSDLGGFAVIQLILLIATLFIYAGARTYFAHKFGGIGEDDEEYH
ncbi:MAG: DUF2178 domain-containing protein [Methanocorpusculum sp.]|nr:DUF2178 domain-containing protein [Methanocorpusculum sp.]